MTTFFRYIRRSVGLRVIKFLFVFFVLYFKLFKIKGKITCYSGSDGGGAQLQRHLSVALICDFYGIEFIFSPINSIDSTVYIKNSDLIHRWNNLINFYEKYKANRNYDFKLVKLFLSLLMVPWTNQVIAIRDAHRFADLFTDKYTELIKNQQLSLSYQHTLFKIPIVIHLRRPAFPPTHPTYDLEKKRQINSVRFLDTVLFIKSLTNQSDINGVVFLASHDNETLDLKDKFPNLIFDDFTDAFTAILLMSSAEVLVVAHSSMSYLAGLFNFNTVLYYGDFWHSPKSTWKKIT